MFPTPSTMSNVVPTKLEFQEDTNYCGAACAAMVLDEIGPNRLTQKELYDESHDFDTADDTNNWFSSPDGLADTLNNNLPPAFTEKFKLYANGSQLDIARRMAWTIFKFKLPCITAVLETDHWIVVYGFDHDDAEPSGPRDTQFNILGLYVNDPWETERKQNHIDYSTWQENYAATVDGGPWDGRYIAICDPSRKGKKTGKVPVSKKGKPESQKPELNMFNPANSPIQPKENAPLDNPIMASKSIDKLEIPQPPMKNTINPVTGKKIIDEISAGKYAVWTLQTRSFYNPKMLSMMMTKPSPGKPLLVKYLGRDDFYYLVPIKENNKIYSVMSISATKEKYREASFAMDRKKPMKFNIFGTAQIKKLLTKTKKFGGSEQFKKINITKSLVWKPCSQSLSPYMPFYEVKIKNRKVYIRLDGKVFPKLTQGALGF
jgi:hypothetical protein